MFNQQSKQNQLEVKKLIVVEREGYQNQYIRDYQLDVNYNTLNSLQNLIDRKSKTGINNIKGVDVANLIPDTMLPSSNPSGVGKIINNWGQKRALFMLEASSRNSNGYSETVYYVQGYTEYWDLSFGNKMADDMKFYINTLMTLQRTYNPNTKMIHSRIIDNFSVIHDDTTNTFKVTQDKSLFGNNNSETLVVARPDDVLMAITEQQLLGGNNSGLEIIPNSLLSIGGESTKEPILVDRTKASTPTSHIAETMTGIMQAQSGSSLSYSSEDVYDHAATITRTKNIEDILFMRKITEAHGLETDPFFTLDDIRGIDTNFGKDNFFIFTSGTPYRKPTQQQLQMEDTEHSYSPTEENRIISLISTSLSTYMAENGLLYVMLSITNKNGLPEVIPLGGNSLIDGLNIQDMLTKLSTKVLNELVPVITRQNMQMVEIIADIDLLGNSVITISINSGDPTTMNIPTAMDSTISPIITNDANFNTMVSGYKSLSDIITVNNQ